MAGRRSVWSDPRLIELAQSFVTAADEVWRLQRGQEADCHFFQRAVNGGELITDKGTRQGIWIITPGAELLASINSLDAEAVLRTLERGLVAWHELTPRQHDDVERGGDVKRGGDVEGGGHANVAAVEPEHRWEHSYPEGGLVLERIARDLVPASEPTDDADALPAGSKRWNRDFAWFARAETRDWLTEDPRPGEVHGIPAAAALRLARFHLVDNVRGQTLPYAESEILEAVFSSKVGSRTGPLVELQLSGKTRAVAAGPWLLGENLWKPRHERAHGIETRCTGRASFDLERGVFTSFELIALGRRWGSTDNNGRWRDPAPGLIGFALTLAPQEPRIAPTFIALYDADWVEHPPAR